MLMKSIILIAFLMFTGCKVSESPDKYYEIYRLNNDGSVHNWTVIGEPTVGQYSSYISWETPSGDVTLMDNIIIVPKDLSVVTENVLYKEGKGGKKRK